jgi:hypothetical protein
VNVFQQTEKYEIKAAKTFTIEEWFSGDIYECILDVTDFKVTLIVRFL